MTQLSRFRVSSRRAAGSFACCSRRFLSHTLIVLRSLARAADVFQLSGDEANAMFDKAKAALVQVRSGDKDFVLAGTGFFIDDQGTVLTSSSILGDNTSARVVINGVEMNAKILGNDPRSGLAMLRVSYGASPSLPLAHVSNLQTGDGVVMIGYPLNLPVASSQGPVNGFEASYLTRVEEPDSPKNRRRGGALRDDTYSRQRCDQPRAGWQSAAEFARRSGGIGGDESRQWPIDLRAAGRGDAEAHGRFQSVWERARHGWVGVNVMEVSDGEHDGRTVRVVQVVPGTPASESGIRSGDTVMRIDAREIYRPADVLDASFFTHVGGNMTVVVRRDDKLYNYTFAVIERPQASHGGRAGGRRPGITRPARSPRIDFVPRFERGAEFDLL